MNIKPCATRFSMLLKALNSSRDRFATASEAAEPISFVSKMDIRGIPFDF